MNAYRFLWLPEFIQRILLALVRRKNKLLVNLHKPNYSDSIKKYQLCRPLGPKPVICYAPFKSMYFGMNGKVVACCLNRSHVFGRYPEQNISEIWNGQKIKELRDVLKHADLSKGCFHCKNRIDDGNFDAVEAALFDVIPLKNHYPAMMEFELSNECNLQCIMCTPEFSSSIGREMGKAAAEKNIYDENFVSQLDEFIPHLVKAKFLGGEPFLIKAYYKIWERIIQLNPKCMLLVQTNATVLDDRIKSLLERGNFRVGVSIESIRKETLERIRKNCSFEKVISNIVYFSEYAKRKKTPFSISVCPMRQNWEELPEIIEQCNTWNAGVYFNTVWTPAGCSLYHMPLKELIVVWDTLKFKKLPSNSLTAKRNKIHFDDFVKQLESWVIQKREKLEKNKQEFAKWEEDGIWLEKTETNELVQSIRNKIIHYFQQNKTVEQNDNDSISLIKKLDMVIDGFQQDIYLKRAIYKLNDFPDELIVQELLGSDIDKLKDVTESIIEECKTDEIKIKSEINGDV